jgi:hypothetical protein
MIYYSSGEQLVRKADFTQRQHKTQKVCIMDAFILFAHKPLTFLMHNKGDKQFMKLKNIKLQLTPPFSFYCRY